MQIQEGQQKNRILVRSFNEIEIEPTPIHYLFYCEEDNNLYVSRQKSTQVYHILQNQASSQIQFQHIARLPWSKYILKVHSTILLFCPFQLRTFSNNSWDIHPFTTELLSIKFRKVSESVSMVYSFHEQQVIVYKLSNDQDEDDFSMNYLSKAKMPFHVTKQSIVQGYGKKIVNNNKKAAFTVCEFKFEEYVVIGDSQGSLHIYDFKTLGHLKTFKKHLGPILAIKIDEKSDTIFFSGSDSKIAAVHQLNSQWQLSGEIRGQSHDVFTLEVINQTLISGGLTTDICCYPLSNSKQKLLAYVNKISYRSQSVVNSMKNYLLINKLTSFELWKIRQKEKDLQFLIRYQMPAQKFIKDLKISKRLSDKTNLIVVSTQIDTIGWKFSQIDGLVKLFTIKNCYEFIQFLPGKNMFVGLRDTGDIQKVYCKTGKIEEIINSQLSLPTDMKLLPNQKLLIGSNLSNQIKVFDLKKKCLLSKSNLKKVYQILCEKNENQFLIKYVEDRRLYGCSFNKKLIQQTQIYQLPQNSHNVRYGGVIIHESQVTKNHKKYWYFANENKVLLVNNLNNQNKRKIVRSIYTRQIGTVVKPKVNKSFEIGLVHFNFTRMINNMETKPLISKKIH